MKKGKSYLIQVPNGEQVKAEFKGTDNNHYILKFESSYSKREKKVLISRFESGVACFEGTDHLILNEVK